MERHWHANVRDTLVVLLTVTTGVVDAACFLGLGSVFSSVITGNLVLLGVAAGTQSVTLAAHSGVALAGYSAGVAVGAPLAARRAAGRGTWPPSVTVTLSAELFLMSLVSVGWELTRASRGLATQLALVGTLAACMGMQGAAVRQLGQMSTTYLTSTLTGVVGALATRTRLAALPRSVGVLAAIVTGAVIGSVVVKVAPAWLPAAMLAPLGAVIVLSVAGFEPVREHMSAARENPGDQ
ncbi:MAG: DUF1275 domain-containing protein [Actinobacteria bacterium]|nr:DUF1275 domain-containing protein [Actinomycetota bacterium]